MIELTQGTAEYILVDIEDKLGVLITLDGLTMKYDIKDHSGVSKITQGVALNTGMIIKCLADTNVGGLWPAGRYDLWVDVTVGSEHPRLGPFRFNVV